MRSRPRSPRSSPRLGATGPGDMGKVMAAAKAALRRHAPTWRWSRPRSSAALALRCTGHDPALPVQRLDADVCGRAPAHSRGDGRGRGRRLSQRRQQPARLRRRPDQPTNASIEAAARGRRPRVRLPAGRLAATRARRRSPASPSCWRRCRSRSSPSAAPARARAGSVQAARQRLNDAVRRSALRRARRAVSANTHRAPDRRKPRIGGASKAPVAARGEPPHFRRPRVAPAHSVAADRPDERVHRPLGRMAGPRCGADQRRQRHRPQGVQHRARTPISRSSGTCSRRVFLLAAGYTMLRQGHVRSTSSAGRFSKRTQIWIDIIGLVFFVLPLVYTVDPALVAAGRARLRDERDTRRTPAA